MSVTCLHFKVFLNVSH